MVKATTSSVSVSENTTAPKAKKTSKKEAAPEPVVEATEAVAEPAEKADVTTEINDELADLMKLMQERSALDNQIKTRVKNIEKKVARMSKIIKSAKKKKSVKSNKVSGFEKPTPISDELAKFVGEPSGTLMARTAISKKIHEYVKSNDLQDEKNRRIIVPDAKLKKLLKTGPNDTLSYFNLQRFLKVHFKKQ
jgi:chromatin remodeling complex protein RSC6